MRSPLFKFALTTTLLSSLLGAVGILTALPPQAAQAVRLRDGKVYFTNPPRLGNVSTTFNRANAWGAKYDFTLTVPEDAGEPLGQVAIVQQENVTDVRFDAEETAAFIGTPGDRGEDLPIGAATFDRDSRTVTVTFDPPVPPGTTLTVRLRPERNPRYEGVYLFGVTTFPAGGNPYGQFVGYGRLNFYNGGSRFIGIFDLGL